MEFRLIHLEWLFALCVPTGTAPSQIVPRSNSNGNSSLQNISSSKGGRTLGKQGTVATEFESTNGSDLADRHEQTAQDVAAKVLNKFRHHFFPSVFDSLPIIAAKLCDILIQFTNFITPYTTSTTGMALAFVTTRLKAQKSHRQVIFSMYFNY